VHLKRTPREEAQWAHHTDGTEAVGWDEAGNCVVAVEEEEAAVEFLVADGSLEEGADGSLALEVDKILVVEVDGILVVEVDGILVMEADGILVMEVAEILAVEVDEILVEAAD
jgi:hypothetical protein